MAYGVVILDIGPVWLAPWGLAIGSAGVLTAMLLLGARRKGRVPRSLVPALIVTFVATAGGLGYALAAAAPAPDGPLLLGLPRTTAVMLILVGAVPLVWLPVAYARAFEKDVLNTDDINSVLEAAAAVNSVSEAAVIGAVSEAAAANRASETAEGRSADD